MERRFNILLTLCILLLLILSSCQADSLIPSDAITVSETMDSEQATQQSAASTAENGTKAPGIQEPDGILEITFLDVGQADAAVITCGGRVMLIDGGNAGDSDLIYTYLRNRNITHLDYIICSHAHEDHVGGIAGALHAASASVIYAPVTVYDSKPFNNFLKAASDLALPITIPEVDSSFDFGGAQVQILGPLQEYSEPNNTSIILKIIYGDTSFLFTGDMEREAELDLIEAGVDLSADVLKVAHHGSNTSSSYVFLHHVAPGYGVISCGKGNQYDHPHEEVLSRLRDAEVILYRTDLQGDITCKSDGKTIEFNTEKNETAITNPTAVDDGIYIGNRNSKKLHLPTCNSLPAEKNRVYFNSISKAYEQGYAGCGNCFS